jgi:hypothetical protein
MGKKAKEHRKKVKARNERIKGEQKRITAEFNRLLKESYEKQQLENPNNTSISGPYNNG